MSVTDFASFACVLLLVFYELARQRDFCVLCLDFGNEMYVCVVSKGMLLGMTI